MSEPMSSVEIEDVLSSIRRLVSQDLRPAPRALPKAEDKLLLTPALRVVPSVPSRPRSALPRLHLGAAESAPSHVPAGPAAEAEFESETGDPAPHVAQMEWTENGWVLAADARPQPQSEPSVAAWDQEAPEEESVPEPQRASAYVEEAAPSSPDIAPESEAERVWANSAEAEVRANLDAESIKEDAKAAEETELYFDEEALRGLVRDILREELQGPLGERITRSVRKLVHAEIARMVAAQSLD